VATEEWDRSDMGLVRLPQIESNIAPEIEQLAIWPLTIPFDHRPITVIMNIRISVIWMHSMDLSFLETQMLHWQLGTGITGSRVIEQHLTRKISKRKSFSAYMVVSLRIGGNRRLVATEHWWQ
jgi:hypothetical protein